MCLVIGRTAGIVSDERWSAFQKTKTEIEEVLTLLKSVALSPQVASYSTSCKRQHLNHCRNGFPMDSMYKKTG
jgi:tRNA U34 5-carboxymethylaminomethyl modifying enzyme MnmG/GidA